jgi:hypothetical protein
MSPVLIVAAIVIVILVIRALIEVLLSGPGPFTR